MKNKENRSGSQNKQMKQQQKNNLVALNNIYYLIVSVGQESGLAQLGSLLHSLQ